MLRRKKKTGYERVSDDHTYSFVNNWGEVKTFDDKEPYDYLRYEGANYYSDRTIAENNARADKLMRQLRRFAVEHRFEDMRWNDDTQSKHYIVWDCGTSLGIHHCTRTREPGVVYFDSIKAAVDAIEAFHDELVWYFTEYKDSL